jgi:hypothetical protein
MSFQDLNTGVAALQATVARLVGLQQTQNATIAALSAKVDALKAVGVTPEQLAMLDEVDSTLNGLINTAVNVSVD